MGMQPLLQSSATNSGGKPFTKQNAHNTALCSLRKPRVQKRRLISFGHSVAEPARSCSISHVSCVLFPLSSAAVVIAICPLDTLVITGLSADHPLIYIAQKTFLWTNRPRAPTGDHLRWQASFKGWGSKTAPPSISETSKKKLLPFNS